MTEVTERPIDWNGHTPDASHSAFENIAGQLQQAYGRGYDAGALEAVTPTDPTDFDGPVNADDVTQMYREYTHMLIDELFDCLGLEDVGFGKKSGVIAFFDGAITTGTYQERLIAMIRRWGEYVASPMVEDCGSSTTTGCQFRRCLVHNLPDLCQEFRVDPELQHIFDEMNRRGVWRFIGSDGSDGPWGDRYLNALTGKVVHHRPADYQDIDENNLVTREGGL